MPTPHQLVTPRLLLRPFTPADRAPFAAMNADPVVMHYFASTYTPDESDAAIARYTHELTLHWVVDKTPSWPCSTAVSRFVEGNDLTSIARRQSNFEGT